MLKRYLASAGGRERANERKSSVDAVSSFAMIRDGRDERRSWAEVEVEGWAKDMGKNGGEGDR